MEAEWRCTESRLKEKVGLGARGTQVPTKEPGFSSADTPPKNKQPLQHGQISCVHMCCVKAETQKRRYMHRMLESQLYENDMFLSKYYITNRYRSGYHG